MSPRFPMGVATMYKLLVKTLSLIWVLFIIYSCTPRIIVNEDISTKERGQGELEKVAQKEVDIDQKELDIDQKEAGVNQTNFDPTPINQYSDQKIISEIEIILPSENNIQKKYKKLIS